MFDFLKYIIDILINIVLLLSLGSIYILLPFKRSNTSLQVKLFTGVIIGLIGLIIMNAQFNITEGFLLDTRSVLLSTSAVFFGLIPGLIAAVMTSILRIYQGGAGTFTGVLVIFLTMFVGVLFRKYRLQKLSVTNYRFILEFYLFGIVTHIVMILCFFTLPLDTAMFVLGIIFWPVMILFPLATLPLATILMFQERNIDNMEKIDYISKHDFLTNLYNRHHFETIIDQMDNEKNYPLSIIMGDVNGLKLINDSYGHLKGDSLLVTISQILSQAITENQFLIRWGGDEFIIVAPNTDLLVASDIILDIKNRCKRSSFEGIEPSISLGVSLKTSNEQNIDAIIKEAEELMYRNKLSETNSVHSNFISILENTLVERKYETEHHSNNMKAYGIMLGETLGLSQSDLDDISLTAKLHDIGKIGIDEGILLKNGPLTTEEFLKIKKHPEIGYRILNSIKELEHISTFVLHHHERWDGSGYPIGLKAENIPLTSRIISIMDAYEVMTCGRIYQKPKTKEEAVEELKRCSGTQFDPNLTKLFIEIVKDLPIKKMC